MSDPYGIGRDVLEDTPWYIPGADNRRGTERSLGFCNPYGYEDGDVAVMGGLRDPARERGESGPGHMGQTDQGTLTLPAGGVSG